MSITTDKLPPIIIAEYALKLLRKTFQLKLGFRPSISKQTLEKTLSSIESSLMVIKYSYLPLNELLVNEELFNLQEKAIKLSKALEPAYSTPSTNKISLATINWSIQIIEGLRDRLKYADSNLSSGVDLKVVHVRNVQKIDKFLLTRAYDAEKTYTIITNFLDLRPNCNLGVAFLPPRDIGGKLSEAMYLGSEERNEKAGTILSPNQIDLTEVNAILHHLISQKK